MRCGKPDHQLGQKCPAKNAKCKDCHKIGHFHKVCQTKKRAKQRANLAQTPPQDDDDTHINKNGVRQPNPPRANMFKLVNHIEATKGTQGKHLKFSITKHPEGPYKHHIVARVDTGADVNCMNEKTFNELFPEVQLSVCPHEIQNIRNSIVDISILGQFCTYLEFRGKKYLNTFIVTNVNDCPNLLSYGATFRMGVLLPNYPEENVVRGENVPNFKVNKGTSDGTSNIFQILQDLQQKQRIIQYQYNSNTVPNTVPTMNTAQMETPFRTTTPSAPATTATTAKQVDPVHVHINTSWSEPPAHCAHVYKSSKQVCRPGESLALRKVKYPHNGRTSVNRLPLTKQDILSHYSSCFEGIEHFSGEPYKFHLKPECKPARHAPKKVPIHLETAFKEEIKSLVKLGILKEVKEHTDWVNSYVIVEKDTGSHHSPNHTIKKKLRICLDPRDLNEDLEREPYYTHSVDEITAKLQGMTVFTIVDFKKGYWMVVLHPESRKLTCVVLPFGRFHWTRLPMDIVVAQDIFQSKLDSIFIGMEGVTGIADDMVYCSRDEMEHHRNFLAFIEKCMNNNLTLNSEKDSVQAVPSVFLWPLLVKT